MNHYHLREAAIEDLPEIKHVISVAMEQYAKISSIPTKLDALTESDEDLRRHIQEDYFLLAFHGETLSGTLRVSKVDTLQEVILSGDGSVSGKAAYISRFCVMPDVQKLGVGSALFKAADKYLEKKGFLRVYLHTALANTSLVRFYSRYHFLLCETKNDRGYPRGTFVKNYN